MFSRRRDTFIPHLLTSLIVLLFLGKHVFVQDDNLKAEQLLQSRREGESPTTAST